MTEPCLLVNEAFRISQHTRSNLLMYETEFIVYKIDAYHFFKRCASPDKMIGKTFRVQAHLYQKTSASFFQLHAPTG